MICTERQGIRPDRLEMSSPDLIQIGGESFEFYDTGIDEEPCLGVHIDVLAFNDPNIATQMDAAYIKIKGGHATPIEYLAGPRIFMEKIQKGSATWIGMTPEGSTVSYTFDAHAGNDNGSIVYGAGWIGSWVAGPDGAEILEICIPPFEEDNTITIAEPKDSVVAGVEIPILFQAMYRILLEQPIPSNTDLA